MDDSRTAFLEAAAVAANLLGRFEVTDHWNESSILPGFNISGLAGHRLRGIRTVEKYLDGSQHEGESITAAEYYESIAITADISSSLNRDVRSRGEEEVTIGSHAVAIEAHSLIERLGARLVAETVDRHLLVLGDLSISLDEYLRTRIVELVIHTEDLALSVGLPEAAKFAPVVATVAIDTLVDLARFRHGDWAVLRALARRERDAVSALRVL